MNLADIFNENGVLFWRHGEHHHVGEGWVGTDCPQCSAGSGRVRLGWNLRNGAANCWTCGVLNRVEALKLLTGLGGKACYELIGGMDRVSGPKKIRGKLILPPGIEDMRASHKKYLSGRGFDPDKIAKLWGVKGIGRLGGEYAWRLFIPVTEGGDVVSWTTRAINDSTKAKYVNALPSQESINIKSILYGSDLARHCVICVEGPTDAWRVGPGAVCTFGMVPGRSQISKLAGYAKRGICYDNAPDAQRNARRLCDALSVFDGETFLVNLDADDPGSADEREIRKLRRSFFGKGAGS